MDFIDATLPIFIFYAFLFLGIDCLLNSLAIGKVLRDSSRRPNYDEQLI